jgi:thiamine kinase-like enzyme
MLAFIIWFRLGSMLLLGFILYIIYKSLTTSSTLEKITGTEKPVLEEAKRIEEKIKQEVSEKKATAKKVKKEVKDLESIFKRK